VLVNIERYGNTTSGTIPLATRDAITSGKLKKGDIVLLAAVGAGYNRWRQPLALGLLREEPWAETNRRTHRARDPLAARPRSRGWRP